MENWNIPNVIGATDGKHKQKIMPKVVRYTMLLPQRLL